MWVHADCCKVPVSTQPRHGLPCGWLVLNRSCQLDRRTCGSPISLIWRRYDGREAVLYLLEGELASDNCKSERENDPERKFRDAGRQVAAEEDARQRAYEQRAEYVQ